MAARTATPSLARRINDRLALDLLIEHGPLTAPRLRELTGLSRPTVSDLLDRLGERGLVRAVGEEGADRRGPNAKLYGLIAAHTHVAAVDVRHDAATAVVADLTGEPVATVRRSLSPDVPLTKTIRQAAGDAARRAGLALDAVHNLVIGAPGIVDPRTGDLEYPGWQAIPLPDLRALLGVPVVLENEVNLAAIAELHGGVAAGTADFVLMWLDRGVGGAVVLGGRLRRGASGGAGELGHLSADLPENRCGRLDAEQVVELAAAHGVPGTRPSEVMEAALAAPNPAFLDDLADRVARDAVPAVVVVDPGLIVLAGETGRTGGADLAGRVEARLNKRTPVHTAVRSTGVARNPVLAGAVRVALDAAHDDVFGMGRD